MSEQRSGRQTIADISELKVKPTGSSTLVKVADHLSGWVNVRSYGAKGDGVTDDTAAIQAVIAALGSTAATLIVPGPCVVGTDLTIPANLIVRFLGAGSFTGPGTVTYTGEPANAATLAATAVAESAKTAAEVARDAANATGQVYPDTASGIAAVAEGEYFSVPSAGSSESLILYRDVAGVAVEQKRYPTADAALKPTWTGRKNGWPDPFFRKFGLTSQTFLGRDRWYWNGAGAGEFVGWSRVPNATFDGFALRRAADINNVPLNGLVIHLDELGASAGDTITVYALFVGDGAGVLAPGFFDSGADVGAAVGAQVNPLSVSGQTWVTTSATPQWLRHTVTVPATATRFKIAPYTTTAGKTFDLVAAWAFKGVAATGPDWPVGAEEAYYRTRDDELLASFAAEIVLPPTVYVTEGREMSIYFDNVVAADEWRDYAWDVVAAGIPSSKQQSERWTYTSGGLVFTTNVTVAAHNKTSGSPIAMGTVEVKGQAAAAGTGQTPKCIFIGDSLTAAGTYTGELLTIAGVDALKIALHGTRGIAPNLHEGRSGWKIDDYATAGRTFYRFTVSGVVTAPAINLTEFSHNGSVYRVQELSLSGGAGTFTCERVSGTADPLASGTLTKTVSTGDATVAFSAWTTVPGNPFWIGGALNFPQYLTDRAIPVPDWVFVMLGINDEFAKLDTLIASIKAAGAAIKIGLMTPTPPSFEQDAFATSYNVGQTRLRAKRNILLWNKFLIARYAGQTANRIYVVPTHVNLDTVNNMSRAAPAPVNSRSTVQVARQNNGVHPATEGYYQIADTVWAFLKNQF
jgi:lysophospholipase L1-like esterase